VWSAMCSYNRINGVYSCENNATLGDLKNGAKFQGFVMSDWGATHSTVASAVAGLDQEMPLALYFSETALSAAVQAGTITQAQIDDKVLRILTAMYAVGIFDRAPSGSISANVTSDAHNQLAREFSREATVLVQNTNGLLPLSANTIRSIAVLGDECSTAPIVAGGGSGAVSPPYIITVLQGILNAVPHSVNVSYAGTSDANAEAIAAAADVAIVCTGTWSTEGSDRSDLSLPSAENDLIARVAAAQTRTVVVVTCPGAVLMPWASAVASILVNFMPGQEAGNAVADVLFGGFNPSGRLPLTFPTQENPTNFTQEQYPGEPWYFPENANYSEGLFVGYRWYDAHGVTPLFPFGHGLSYTSFKYSNLEASAHNVTVSVTNIGSVDGSEVAQLYLTFPAGAGEPPRVLKGFQKVAVPVGDTATVTFPLMAVDLSIWDPSHGGFVVQHGEFGVSVGASSRDIRLKGSFTN
jgi:beta-glucosidase